MQSFVWFSVWFQVSWSTTDLLTVVSDRIASAFDRPEAAGAVAFDISKAFDRVWYAGLLHKPKSYWISGQVFCWVFFQPFSVIYSFKGFWIGSLCKIMQLILVFRSTSINCILLQQLHSWFHPMLISILEKLNLSPLMNLLILVLLMWKWLDLF